MPVAVAHLATVALTKALQSYSRSRLEEYCADRGRPGLAAEVGHLDERTERAAEVLAVISGLFLATLIGVALERWHSPPGLMLLVVLVLAVAAVGYVVAGVLGKVFAESILVFFWPAASLIRSLTWPITAGAAGLEYLTQRLASDPESGPRPASVEVEIPTEEGETPEEVEAELPEAAHALLQRAVELTRTHVSEMMIPASAIVSLPVDRDRPGGGRNLPQDRPQPDPHLRREPRRHRRHPARQGPVGADGRQRRSRLGRAGASSSVPPTAFPRPATPIR